MRHWRIFLVLCALLMALGAWATETENQNFSLLPAPGKVVIDGKVNDWDLSGGIFACGDVERFRDKYAVWLYGMYDANNVYVLARWMDDTPMNNPGQTIANFGWDGDCLQIRIITNEGTPRKQQSVANCWKGVDGDVVQMDIEGKNTGPRGVDAKPQGAQQAFLVNADKKGYAQEIAIPWKLLTPDGVAPKTGERIRLTFEPNFTADQGFRISIKDVFRPGVNVDRVFTFMATNCWGDATLEPRGNQKLRAVRLSDAREFPATLANGQASVNWDGLIKTKELRGFKPITFTLPDDGYVSLNIKNAQGQVVRQLLSCAFYTKGKHTVQWDGLTTLNFKTPGDVLPAGKYTWSAIWHKGIGVRFRGWAANAGSAPWDASPTTNWGGDEGVPVACASDGAKVYLGWGGAEAGVALVATDQQGNVQWRHSRYSMSGADQIAVDNGIVYAQNWGGDIYREVAANGNFSPWAGTDSPDIIVKDLWGDVKGMPDATDAMCAAGGKLYLGFTKQNLVLALDGNTGKLLQRYPMAAPVSLAAANGKVYAISNGTAVLALDPATGATTTVINGLANARGLALDADGKLYVGLREPANQVQVFAANGTPLSTIGRKGGRALFGKWTPDGLAFINSLTIAGDGKLWVAEADAAPKRFSCWDTKTGALVKEFFGPTAYGALGGAINPVDPNLMVGLGCEWRLDPTTGRDTCLGVITRDDMGNSMFGFGPNKRLYLATSIGWHGGQVNIFERLGDGVYKLRTSIVPPNQGGKEITVWSDANDDAQVQPDEVHKYAVNLNGWINGWYMPMTEDLTFYGSVYRVKPTGFTACGAPEYDLTKAEKLPAPADVNNRGGMGAQRGMGSADGRYMLYNGPYNVNNATFDCYDTQTGQLAWTYPNNFTGVHGSHSACPPVDGMIRGAYDIVGSAKFAGPLGNIWVIPSNFGEWHILNQDGFYLTKLFEPDPLKFQWPKAVPGASMDSAPSGMGGEDFGGSLTQGTDGKLYLQAGKTGFWNVEVVGLDTVQALKGDTVTIAPADLTTANTFRESYLQEATGTQRVAVQPLTPTFTGNLDTDFTGAETVKYQKQDDAALRTAVAHDATNLYLAWDVKDNTPWLNNATDPAQMYVGGDTVDFQLGTDPNAAKDRGAAVLGDLRLSIGNFQGTPTAVIYRKVSTVKKPKTFSSGVIHAYTMDYVDTVAASIKVNVNPGKGYTVEATIPLSVLGVTPAADLALRGDFGVTHGDPTGGRTRLRTYWSNQQTGIVDDGVFELQLEPKNWGELLFK